MGVVKGPWPLLAKATNNTQGNQTMTHANTLKTLIASGVLLASFSVMAQANTPRVDQRQAHQEQRIDQGIASGELTKREARRLRKGQARVDHLENHAKADGAVSRKERARLHHAQRKQSARIYGQKHDAQDRAQ
jgi:hypothetical protein